MMKRMGPLLETPPGLCLSKQLRMLGAGFSLQEHLAKWEHEIQCIPCVCGSPHPGRGVTVRATGPAVASDFLTLQRKSLEKTNRPGSAFATGMTAAGPGVWAGALLIKDNSFKKKRYRGDRG